MFLKWTLPVFLLLTLVSPPALAKEKNYMILNLKVNWHAAFMFCRRLNAELLTIRSSAEQQNVRNSITEAGMDWVERFWMSGTDLHAQSEWTWMTSGRPMRPYTNWGPGQPDNAGGIERCAEIWSKHVPFSWNDVPCATEAYFICEYES